MIDWENSVLTTFTNVFSSAMESGEKDPCGIAEAIKNNKQAYKDYTDAMIRGDKKAAREAFHRGNLKGLVGRDFKYQIKPDLRAADELNRPLPTPTIDLLEEHLKRLKTQGMNLDDLSTQGLYSTNNIADADKFINSKVFRSYFDNATEFKLAKKAFKVDGFADIFNENLKLGETIKAPEYDRSSRELKTAIRNYNEAINTKKMRTVARKIIYDSIDPQTGFQKYFSLQREAEEEARRVVNQFQTRLAKIAPNKIQDAQLSEDICKEIFGEYTGDSTAKQVAETFYKSQETLKKELSKSGIMLDLQKGYMPASYSARKIAAVPFEDFYQDAEKYIAKLPEESDSSFRTRIYNFYNNMNRRIEDKASSQAAVDGSVRTAVRYSKKINLKDGSSYYNFAQKYSIYNKPTAILSDAIEHSTKLMARADVFRDERGAELFHLITNQEMDKLGETLKIANAAKAFTNADFKNKSFDVFADTEQKLVDNGLIDRNNPFYDVNLNTKERLQKLEDNDVLPKNFMKQMTGDSNDLSSRHWTNKKKMNLMIFVIIQQIK